MYKYANTMRSPVIKKILNIVVLMCTLFLVAVYGLMYWQYQAYRKELTIFEYNKMVEEINLYLQTHHIRDEAILARIISKKNVDYQIILFTPDSRAISVHQLNRDNVNDQPIILPKWRSQSHSQTIYADGQMQVWRNLTNQYRLYGQYKLPAISLWYNKQYPFVWVLAFLTPLLLVLILLMVLYFFLKRTYRTWQSMVLYTEKIDNSMEYEPLKPKKTEFSALVHVLNRLSFRLHKQRKTIQELSTLQKKVIAKSPESLFLLDAKKNILFVNHHFAQDFRIEEKQAIGKNLCDLILAANMPDQYVLDNLHNEPKQLKILVKASSAKNKYDLLLNPIYDQNNDLLGFSGVLHDVNRDQTELAKMQLSQLEIDDRLTANEKLWAVMGHELRTPLNGMIGMIQLLGDTNLDDEQRDFWKTLKSSSDSMLFLLNDMLDLSKLDAGKMESVQSNIDLLSLCRETCDLMIGHARKKEVELIFFASMDLPRFVVTDPFRLRQVFLNLLGNAFKFTQRGHVALLVKKVSTDHKIFEERFIRHEKNQQWLCFRIIDTGPGIPQNEQEQLFYFFNQANNTISRRFGGTGLGLAISKGLIEMLGGFIHLQSEENRGTNFDVYLPVVIEKQQAMYKYPEALGNQLIVFFDASPLNRGYVSNLLNSLQAPNLCYDSLSTANLDLALTRSQTEHQTTVLMIDYDLLSEHVIAHEILEHKLFKSSKKLLMSYRSQRSIPARVMASFDGFIEKPLMIEGFLAEILRVSRSEKMDNKGLNPSLSFQDMVADVNDARHEKQKTIVTKPKVEKLITVLLAEDNIINQKVASKMLEKQNCNVIIAANGEIAIEKLQEHEDSIDLVLMDCRMPKMDGLTATRKIRELKYSLPIIALTANDTKEDRIACEEAGMDDFLAKPINQEKLVDLLAHYSPVFNKTLSMKAVKPDLL